MPMGWDVREGQRCRVVDEEVLLAWYRARLMNWKAWQAQMRVLDEQENDTEG